MPISSGIHSVRANARESERESPRVELAQRLPRLGRSPELTAFWWFRLFWL